MEEFKKFINLLKKNRLLLIIIPVATVLITYFLVRNLPDSYVSQAQIATGIVDQSKKPNSLQQSLTSQQIIQEFSNLLATMKMKHVLDQVSYQLMIHDLSTNRPFRQPSKLLSKLSANQRATARKILINFYNNGIPLNLYHVEQKKLYDLLISMKYDSETLKDRVQAFRAGDSDFIVILMESEDPELSAYIVNSVSNEFIRYYTKALKGNQIKTTAFLRQLLAQKSDTLSSRMNALRDYKVKNRVLNLDEQSKQSYARIIEYENKKQEALQQTSSFAGALGEIDAKFNPNERKYLESITSKLNLDIVATKDEISRLYDEYYKNDLDEKYKTSIDSLNSLLSAQIGRSSDAYIVNPLNGKEALIAEKLTLETQLDISRYSISSLDRELGRLNDQFEQLVPREADVQQLSMDIDLATEEYTDVLNKFNQSNLENSFETRLNVAQSAMSGLPQPSKKMLLVLISGIISFVFCLLIFFVIFYFDNSITTPKELANVSQKPVIGSLRKLALGSINLNEIWNSDQKNKVNIDFKSQLRSLRYDIEEEIKGKIIAISSISPQEGKTLLTQSLAFAWKMTNHKVLIIDGNQSNQEISKSAGQQSIYLEDFIHGKSNFDENQIKHGTISTMRNNGGNKSLLELDLQENIQAKIASLKSLFDIIIIDTSSQDDMNNVKEWMLFCDSVIGVFKCGQGMTDIKASFMLYLKNHPSFVGWVLNQSTNKEN